MLYEQMGPSSHAVTNQEMTLQPNLVTVHEVIMDTNPAYESCEYY